MARARDDEFFQTLRRRTSYSKKRRDGANYEYHHYRKEIAEDCLNRCGYCDCHERELGGPTSMDLDHFRPKSLKRFKHLVNDPCNLVYACKSCNGLKSDWWPPKGKSATFVGEQGFLDPFAVDRRDYFVIEEDGAIRAEQPPASYMIALLALDRPFLRRLREVKLLKLELARLVEDLKKEAEEVLAEHSNADPKKLGKLALEVVAGIKKLIAD